MKKSLCILAAAALLLFSLSACASKPKVETDDGQTTGDAPAPPVTGLANPLKFASDMAGLAELVGFTPPVPTALPTGYAADTYISISGATAQVIYKNGGASVIYRVKKGTGSISGVYNEYPYSGNVTTAAGASIPVKGASEDSLSLAEWEDATYTYSIYSEKGISKEDLLTMIDGVK